ncbi:TlpA family protein disulfide reductase [Dictyoglomus turgidum]|uniref:Redoxin domain protein n=2 Tax=Dictyoglomus TaxID=13 RepID=B8E302_DICTD|nr:Redoxin domain protein [Dictyoglomus turgidum DSM 6724]HBU32041.1 TlpA family protein disulfide reductase [Dictyoglomus sp.]
MRKSLILKFLILFIFMVFFLTTSIYPKQTQISENSPALDFTLPDIKGKQYSLSSFKGNVILLNFWATWCPPCRYEVPMLDKIQKEYKDKKFKIVAVSLDSDINALRDYLKNVNVSFLVLSDKKGSVGYAYNILAIPTSFLIDKKFVVRKIYLGILPEKEFKKDLEKWLKD